MCFLETAANPYVTALGDPKSAPRRLNLAQSFNGLGAFIAAMFLSKLMWGSDYPRTITAITYKMSYDFILKTTEMTQEEKALFLGKNAERFYGFKNLISLPYIKNMSE
jgi:fucose permease